MINFKVIEKIIKDGLYEWLKNKGVECPVIMANKTDPTPNYPYIAFTVTSVTVSDTDHYSVARDGTRFKQMEQIWSFTVQSDDDAQSTDVALLAYDWFALTGNTYLSDNNITALRVGNVTNRDNMLTIEYEYRRGFDVTFLLSHTLEKADCETAGYIESANIKH